MKFLRLLLYIGLFFMIAVPASALTIEVDTPDDPVEVGEVVTVPVKIKFEEGEAINGLTIIPPTSGSLMDVYIDKNEVASSSSSNYLALFEGNVFKLVTPLKFDSDTLLFNMYIKPKYEQNISVNVTLESAVYFDSETSASTDYIDSAKVENGKIIVKKSTVVNPTTKPPEVTNKPTDTAKPTDTGKPADTTKPDDNSTDSEDTSLPGFGLLSAILGLGATGIVLRRRK